jgi:hypothetical protein
MMMKASLASLAVFAILNMGSSASAQTCGGQATVEACVACVQKKGIQGPRGGWDWCRRNVGQNTVGKPAKKN